MSEVVASRIKPLDPQLVNRIAAGEIIQRPFNALKELIENCLDAGSTNINIQIKEGGLKLIQISDNGCGIEKDDLKIVCERFTTSKLKEFEDLKSINTFGFRGEALASISHVSRLTIITRTANSPCAFKATYTDGKLSVTDGIKPCASASKGTQISIEDLFYNSSIRRNALKNGTDEFAKIYEVVTRYAIHNYHVGFYLKRVGDSNTDLKTTGCLATTGKGKCVENESFLMDNIGAVYGSELRQELERLSIDFDPNYKFEMLAYCSNSKYTQLKQMIFVLFINERLVDCQPIKKVLQSLFALYMPKNTNPFIYISLTMNPNNIDVNIHPTKHEIRFLYQDEIIDRIQKCFEDKLLNSNVSRTHYVKNLTLDVYMDKTTSGGVNKKPSRDEETTADGQNEKVDKIYPYQLSRVDSRERKLDSFFHSTQLNESIRSFRENSQTIKENECLSSKTKTTTAQQQDQPIKSILRNQNLSRNLNFKSLTELRDSIEKNTSRQLKTIMQDMSFVGCVDRELALVQHQTGLYLVNTNLLSQDLFYQIAVFNFGNFGYLRLEEPIKIFDLALMALNDPLTGWTSDDGPKEKLANRCAKFLFSKAAMLEDFFSIKIKKELNQETNIEEVYVETLPMLMEDFEPNLVDLPLFMIRLSTEVEWKEEMLCFDSICREISLFYSIKNKNYTEEASGEKIKSTKEPTESTSQPKTSSQAEPNENWIIEHILYNSFRNMLLPSNENEKQTCFKIVDLSKLYKVFERC